MEKIKHQFVTKPLTGESKALAVEEMAAELKRLMELDPNNYKEARLLMSNDMIKAWEEYFGKKIEDQYPLGFEGMDAKPPLNNIEVMTPDNIKRMQNYAKKYLKEHPGIDRARLTRVVAKKFKIKLK